MDITYGEHTFQVEALPEASVKALLSRGLTHFLGNEMAAKVSTAKAKASEAGSPMTEAAIAEMLVEVRANAVKALLEGTIGVRESSGPRITPLDRRMREAAKQELLAKLQVMGVKVPKKMDVAFYPPAQPVDSVESLIAKWLAKHDERLRKEAEAAIRAEERRLAKIRESAADMDLGV